MQHCHPVLFGVCLFFFLFVLSQLNIPTSGLRFIQHIRSSCCYHRHFFGVLCCHGWLPSRSWQLPLLGGALEAELECSTKGERNRCCICLKISGKTHSLFSLTDCHCKDEHLQAEQWVWASHSTLGRVGLGKTGSWSIDFFKKRAQSWRVIISWLLIISHIISQILYSCTHISHFKEKF